MNYFARVVNGVVAELWNDGGLGLAPGDVHVPELAIQFIPCPENIVVGAAYDDITFANPEPAPNAPMLLPIIIESVTGDEEGFDNGPNEYTCRVSTAITITGPLAVPDQKFRVPCAMVDTGRTIVGVADVVSGVMTLTVTFPELGYWQTTQGMLNKGLPAPVFALPDPIKFVVI